MMRSSSRARWTSGTTSACPSWLKELKTRQPCSPSKHSVSTLPRATTWVDRCPRTSSNNGSLTTATHSRCSPRFRFEQGTQASRPSVGQLGYRSRGRNNSRHHQTVEKSPWAFVEGRGGLGLRRCCGHGFSAASWVGGVRRGVPAGARLHLRALSADGAQARGRQLRQRHPGCRCTDRATPHARHFVLRWRTLLLRCGHLRGSVPVQRVQWPGRVPGGNLFTGGLEGAFATDAFRAVTGHGAPQK